MAVLKFAAPNYKEIDKLSFTVICKNESFQGLKKLMFES